MDKPPLGISLEAAGIIVFVVSGIVILAMPATFLWMLYHTRRERQRWNTEAKREMRKTIREERRAQAALMREREARRQEKEQEQEQEPREGGDHRRHAREKQPQPQHQHQHPRQKSQRRESSRHGGGRRDRDKDRRDARR